MYIAAIITAFLIGGIGILTVVAIMIDLNRS